MTYSEGRLCNGRKDGSDIGLSFRFLGMGQAHEGGRGDQSRESGVETHVELTTGTGKESVGKGNTGEKKRRSGVEEGSYIERG